MTARPTLTLAGPVPAKHRKPSDIRRNKARQQKWRELKRIRRSAFRACRRALEEAANG